MLKSVDKCKRVGGKNVVVVCTLSSSTNQTAKSAFLGSAPQVLKDCEMLIAKRNQLRVSLFSAFAVSAETLNKVANLKPTSSFDAPTTLATK